MVDCTIEVVTSTAPKHLTVLMLPLMSIVSLMFLASFRTAVNLMVTENWIR